MKTRDNELPILVLEKQKPLPLPTAQEIASAKRWADEMHRDWLAYERQRRIGISRLFERIESGKVRCGCGGRCTAQVINGGCQGHQTVRFHCSRKRCYRTSRWHPAQYTVEAFQDWLDDAPNRARRKRRSK